jgi:hypothetical protein
MPSGLSDQNPPKQIADIDLKIGTSKHLNIKPKRPKTNLTGLTSASEAGIRRKVLDPHRRLRPPCNPKKVPLADLMQGRSGKMPSDPARTPSPLQVPYINGLKVNLK